MDSVEIAKQRIAYRVQHGGHGIPDEDVERRYVKSRLQLTKIIDLCDLAIIYDNTESFRRFAVYENGELITKSDRCPNWYKELGV